jgi:MscS family membrane protein
MKEQIINFLNRLTGGEHLQNPYILSAIILLFFVLLAKLTLYLFSKYLDHIAAKTKTKVDDLIFDHTKKPIFFVIITYGLKLSLQNLNIHPFIIRVVNSISAVIFLYILLKIFDVFIETWGLAFAKKTKTKIDEILLPLFQKAGKVVFVIISLMWVLNIWKINITPYLAGVGISGLILGMALQDSLKNVFGGISLLLDKNFHLGDPVRLESGELGKVKEIGLRSTKLLTFDNEVIFIPNGQLANMKIHNYLKPNTRVRKIVNFSVAYGTDISKVKALILPEIKKVKDIYNEPYMDVIFTEMGDYGLHCSARFFVDWDLAYSKWLEVTDVVHNTLNTAGIEIPFPTRTIYMKQ